MVTLREAPEVVYGASHAATQGFTAKKEAYAT